MHTLTSTLTLDFRSYRLWVLSQHGQWRWRYASSCAQHRLYAHETPFPSGITAWPPGSEMGVVETFLLSHFVNSAPLTLALTVRYVMATTVATVLEVPRCLGTWLPVVPACLGPSSPTIVVPR